MLLETGSREGGMVCLGQIKTKVHLPASLKSDDDERHRRKDIDHSLSCAPVIVPGTLLGDSRAGETMIGRERVLMVSAQA